ncbi:MAG: ApbE family lipoprotein [Ferruginibacter sp.]|nr:ApbE family lipoprotein [Ferruginibacter sp.]
MPAINQAIESRTIFKKVLRLMGNRFELSVVASEEDEGWAHNCIETAIGEIRRIETLLTTFNEESQANLVNRNAGIKPVRVDKELIDLVTRSKKISELTQGAFDISYGSIDKRLWNFDQQMDALPDVATARQLVKLINYRNVITDAENGTVYLKEKGMRIGFGGIGKGYAAERAKYILQQNGVDSGIVNAAGDLTTWGYQPDGKPWTIGIASPDGAHTPFSWLNITDMSVATSGNYEKYVVIGGKKYSHTIDPRTGLPVHGIKSVTIISPNAEIADAMATPVMIMGIRVGLNMINQIKGIACIIIDDKNKIYTSANINIV